MDFLTAIARGLLGISVLIGIAVLFSRNRRAINWRLVAAGLCIQLVIGVLVLHVAPVRAAIAGIGAFIVRLLSFTAEGTSLLFGWLWTLAPGNVADHPFTAGGPVFALTVLPSIIFFAAFSSVLYRLGILQWIIYGIAWLLSKTMRLSGTETLNSAANIFVGQTEAPLLIKPYLARMTESELLAVMIGGMATIAGGVMAAYITFLGGADPADQARWAAHLLTASALSAPAALLTAKILFPQTEAIDTRLHLNDERPGSNLIDAVVLGTTDGVKLAVNVGAMLLVFTAMVALANWLLANTIGAWTGLNPWIAEITDGQYSGLTFELLLGLAGAPLAWVIGIDSQHILTAGHLLGQRTILNEFYAFLSMNEMQATGVLTDERTRVIMAYALCGFANIVSIGIQVGGIGALAPEKRAILARLGWRALLGGTLACLLTACVAGMLLRP